MSYPNQVATLDTQGHLIGQYWHSGHLSSMAATDLDGDGADEIILGGVNDGYGTATLVVLDPRNLAGASRQPPGDLRQLQGFGPGTEKAIVRFPRSCMNEVGGTANRVAHFVVMKDLIEVVISENFDSQGPYVVYELDHQLGVKDLIVSDYFRVRHRELEVTGHLDHSLSDEEIRKLRNIEVVRRQ